MAAVQVVVLPLAGQTAAGAMVTSLIGSSAAQTF